MDPLQTRSPSEFVRRARAANWAEPEIISRLARMSALPLAFYDSLLFGKVA